MLRQLPVYGSRAGNGVIQIITKSGRKNNGLGVTISSSVGVERLFMVPRLQSQFGQGTDGAYKNDVSSSWGPRIEGQEYTKWDGTKTTMQAYDQRRQLLQVSWDRPDGEHRLLSDVRPHVHLLLSDTYRQ